MSSRPVYQMCAQVAPSGECLRGYKPGTVISSRLAPRVWQLLACAKPCCYTWPACWYLLCCPAWQLVYVLSCNQCAIVKLD